MRINHNIQALNAYRNLSSTTNATSKSLEKLSSGLRINRAADDAAGLAISEKMRSQIRGLGMAERNSLDAISLIQTAEGALSSTHEILQRMRELSVQAANGTLEETDRQAIQEEINQLTYEIDRISDTTQFNQKKLLTGSEFGTAFAKTTNDQVAYDRNGVFKGLVKAAPTEPAKAEITFPISVGELDDAGIDGKTFEINGKTYEIDNDNTNPAGISDTGHIAVNITGWNPAAGTDADKISNINKIVSALESAIKIADPSFNTSVETAREDSTGLEDGNINPAVLTLTSTTPMSPKEADAVGISSSLAADGLTVTNPYDNDAAITHLGAEKEARSAEKLLFTFSDVPKQGDYFKVDGLTVHFGSPAAAYTAGTASVTIDPTDKDLPTVLNELKDVIGSAIADPATKAPALDQTYSVIGTTLTIGTIKTDDGLVGGSTNGMEIEFKDSSYEASMGEALELNFQIGANDSEMLTLSLSSMDAATLGIARAGDGMTSVPAGVNAVKGINVMTTENASAAITAFDNAIRYVSSERSKLGAIQNRLEHTITNLETANENLTASESRIRDLDMAQEMTEFTKNNILNQAGQAMLAQANQLPQGILQLLQ